MIKPQQVTKNPGSIPPPRVVIEIKAHKDRTTQEIFNVICTLFRRTTNLTYEEPSRTKIDTAATSTAGTTTSRPAKPSN